jgi:CRP/FNR family cyclic AMP-dependent transcriptional regulator
MSNQETDRNAARAEYEDEKRAIRLLELVEGEERLTAQPKETFIQEGTFQHTLIYIHSGTVRTYVADYKRELTFGWYGAGACFGELTLTGGARTASIQAVTETVYSLPSRARVLLAIKRDPEFGLDLLHRAAERARVTTGTARALALQNTYNRLRSALIENAKDNHVTLSQQELSAKVGCTRPMVTKLVKDLTTAGLVRTTDSGAIELLQELPYEW